MLTLVLISFQNCKEVQVSNYDYNIEVTPQQKTIVTDLPPHPSTILLIQRLTGLVFPHTSDFFIQVNNLVHEKKYNEAVDIIIDRDEFYNITVRDFASKMSVASEVATAPLSDFVATIIGIARDDISAQEMLTGRFYYKGASQSGVRANIRNDIVLSNNHYEDLESLGVNLRKNLQQEENQKVLTDRNILVDLEDPAGVLTSRAFMMAHAFEGTNRRIIEYAFSQFLCSPISEWADGTLSDAFIGRDIGRSPKIEYDTKCKTCHAPVDAYRPATSYFDFVFTNPVKRFGSILYKNKTLSEPSNENPKVNVKVNIEEQLIPSKFRRSSDNFELGHKVVDDNWYNLLSGNIELGLNPSLTSGNGMNSFGELLAQSSSFGECMTKRVFKLICKRHSTIDEQTIIAELAYRFKLNNYSLKKLFASVSLNEACLGVVP